MPLFEDYRPKSWNDFIGNDKAVSRVRAVLNRAKQTGKAFALWIDGASGTGKTTLAKLAAAELDADQQMDVVELDGDKCDKAAVHELESRLSLKAWKPGGFRVCVVNECHSMTPGAVQAWLTLLERISGRVAVIMTTTEGRKSDLFGTFDSPLKSRCICISLTNQGLAEAFAKRAQEIAEAEGLGGAEAKDYLALVRASKNNLREVISQIEGFELYRETQQAA
ncbi:MAG: AAA family ATPase [Planctomycetes bacterium]|nr:AAA family ATPase [Planctomycetota bacterium]